MHNFAWLPAKPLPSWSDARAQLLISLSAVIGRKVSIPEITYFLPMIRNNRICIILRKRTLWNPVGSRDNWIRNCTGNLQEILREAIEEIWKTEFLNFPENDTNYSSSLFACSFNKIKYFFTLSCSIDKFYFTKTNNAHRDKFYIKRSYLSVEYHLEKVKLIIRVSILLSSFFFLNITSMSRLLYNLRE